MTRGLRQYLVGLLLLATLAGCGGYFSREERAAWRGDVERRCLKAGLVQQSDFMVISREINGPGTCGMERPIRISAVSQGSVALTPIATLACPATAHFEAWLRDSVQPAAQTWFGQPVVAIRQLSSYACRSRNNQRGAKISEHAYGNAIDVASFTLADGRLVKVETGWRGAPDEQGFFRDVLYGACERFRTVLGPGSDRFHYNHMHLDLALHDARGVRRYCRPKPVAPPAQPLYTSSIGGGAAASSTVPKFTGEPDGGPLPASHQPGWPRTVEQEEEQ